MSGKVFGVVAGTLRLETVLDDGTHLSEPFYPGKRNKTEVCAFLGKSPSKKLYYVYPYLFYMCVCMLGVVSLE